jgi:CheY-like chemotaxis protein/anti-sigma regulatory factor (Ser/Thr protein kinase)
VAIASLDFLASTLAAIASQARVLQNAPAPAVGGWPRWIERRLAETDEPLRDAREAALRIRDIVRDVKLFSRPDDDDRSLVDVERVMDSSIRMAWNEIRHRARLVRDYGRVPRVDANEARLGQVLLNLVVNAAQAIPEGCARDNEIRVSTRATDGRVMIEVCDTGSGIAPEHLSRIFDPFFTTKPVGLGTGLGLAICRRLVADMGGEITADSNPGGGARFRVVLPVGAGRSPQSTTSSSVPPSTRRGSILVVDDEEAVARALKRALSEYHDVSVAASGREAATRIEHGERFDVIVSDLMMPDLTGTDMYRRLVQVAPEQAARVVFVTGGAFTAGARGFLEEVPNPRIEKPIEPSSLLAIIADLLGTEESQC